MKNLHDAIEQLGNRSRRKLENNTYLIKHDDGKVAVRLHETDVVTYDTAGCTLSSGGWHTVTTKDRINKYSPANISQKDGVWTIGEYLFSDGMRITESGNIQNAKRQTATSDKETKALRLKVSRYTTEYVAKLAAGGIPRPSNGDCWGCLMVTKDGKAPMGGKNHIIQHLKERYYVPSLVVRACERYGVSQIAREFVSRSFQGNPSEGFVKDVGVSQIQKALYRYLKSEIGLAA